MSISKSFSTERDEFFDDLVDIQYQKLHPLLTSSKLYTQSVESESPSKYTTFCSGLQDSLEVASEFIKLVFKNLDQNIFTHQIEQKVIPFSASNSLLYCEKMLLFGYHELDDDSCNQNIETLEEQEPKRQKIDQWMRSVINVDFILPIEENNLQSKNVDSDKESTHSKSSRISDVSKWRRINTSNQKNGQTKNIEAIFEDPVPVNMEKPPEYDEFEERVRVIKMLEIKRKQEMELQEQQAQEEIKKQQQTMKKEIKGYKFTYDFDGKILNTKGIKTEKLPPANYVVQYNLKDDHLIKGKDTTSSKQVIKSMKDIESKSNIVNPNLINTDYQKFVQLQQQQILNDMKRKKSLTNNQPQQQVSRQESFTRLDKNVIKNVMQQSTPFEYDSFMPSIGVKLIFESKIKEGEKYKHDIQDLEQLDRQLKMHKENEPIHITKSEYHKLTEKGNLNRNNSLQNLYLNQQDTKKNQLLQSINLDSNMSQINFNKFNDFSSIFKSENKRAQSLHNSQQNMSIKIENPQLIQGLFVYQDEQKNGPLSNDKKLPQIPERTHKSQQQKKSPNDLFNLNILEDNNWGKAKGGTFYPPDQHIKKPTNNDFKKSLSTLYKLPRERDLLQAKKKHELLINQQIKEQFSKKSNQAKDLEKLTKDYQLGFKQTFYSTRSVFENNLRMTYGNF
ncbi:hypothetical protein TTHERM_00471500 (macronuclear) [Tetrahymena thermophila SB210]|uniref:Uncharacterized protein n=1 Tax=Tetrahymena thermophila (strain SB210) TaxID=312017 RepID=I7MD26_TETTS|nr:hypothetical protein TTHERM_00471500 [Tetrahymena thermophila SB210]EAR85373.2 hypothetical protein TTHERM_00471500 [Tetrahymena thermophila SB210]|eukprot:XP_001033036.2 hypothetical protein TTHERM_00471500 [Tetrahymena thermophila SB210]